MGYPKKTLAAIVASAAAGIAAVVITLATITTANITTGNIATANVQQANITNESVTGTSNIATASTTNLIVGQGTTIKGFVSNTQTLDPNSIAAQACTSTSITLANLKSTDSVTLNIPSTWVTSTIDVLPVAASGAVTVNLCNNSALAADDLPSGAIRATGIIY